MAVRGNKRIVIFLWKNGCLYGNIEAEIKKHNSWDADLYGCVSDRLGRKGK